MRANANLSSSRALVAVMFLALLLPCSAKELPATAGLPDETGEIFTVGKITVDKRARTVRFPATVNMAEGVLEYLLVTDKGKTHESLLATAVSPYQLNIAMLLLGARPTPEITDLPPEQLTAGTLKSAPELAGDNADIFISWKHGGEQRKVRAEEWIDSLAAKAPMTVGPWIYTGSAIYQKRFLAQEEGSIVALVTDPAALINNPRPSNRDDTNWSARKDKIPATGTPVEIIFQLLSNPPTSQPAK